MIGAALHDIDRMVAGSILVGAGSCGKEVRMQVVGIPEFELVTRLLLAVFVGYVIGL